MTTSHIRAARTAATTGRWVEELKANPSAWKIHWILRVAIAAEFIGHGAFGIMGKEAWLNYYAVMGIPPSAAWVLMPMTGVVDITLGLLVLVRPTRAPLAYMAFWGLFTALLRPLSGESWWEVVERSYNFGIPLALLLFHGLGTSRREWTERIRGVPRLTRKRARRFARAFRLIIGAFLIGHGAYGIFADKPILTQHYRSIGLTSLADDPQVVSQAVGWFEIALGVFVLVAAPTTGLLLFICAWKISTEMLYVTSGAYGAGFEVIERAGSYAAPLALICFLTILARETRAESRRAVLRVPRRNPPAASRRSSHGNEVATPIPTHRTLRVPPPPLGRTFPTSLATHRTAPDASVVPGYARPTGLY
ncbi:hypothetical protein J7E93_28070 [Streptomyces sp. ISL-36]|uniref:hypothetical protein n=1 Tax=Streptomyces sp. ISL-36 TaxID=2819182 RepID=UPI001BED2181|nr:hypothetical protein [Streptomyces sp. ISL-36]MBT2443885.1 hypothetical protein [Streptomyces sp. ISL-36]